MANKAPVLKHRFFDANGVPLAGGLLYTYIAGTSTPKATYTDSSAETPNTNPIVLDANGECDIWITTGYYKFVLENADNVLQWTEDNISQGSGEGGGASGVPDGGLTGSVLIKSSDASQETQWKQYAYSGFSSRFNEAFDSTTLEDTLNKIIAITYTPPSVSLSATGSSTIREKGDAVTATTLSAAITKKSDQIAEVRFYEGATLKDTQSSGGGIPNGGTSTYNWTGSFSDNITFKVEIDDDGATGGPTTVNSTRSFSFVYPYYVGAGAASLAAASVAALTKRIIASTASRAETIAATAGQVFYFAYPASYGALTSILDENNFETIGDWTLRTENITGLDTNPVSYRIYEFNNPVAAGSYLYTFKR